MFQSEINPYHYDKNMYLKIISEFNRSNTQEVN